MLDWQRCPQALQLVDSLVPLLCQRMVDIMQTNFFKKQQSSELVKHSLSIYFDLEFDVILTHVNESEFQNFVKASVNEGASIYEATLGVLLLYCHRLANQNGGEQSSRLLFNASVVSQYFSERELITKEAYRNIALKISECRLKSQY